MWLYTATPASGAPGLFMACLARQVFGMPGEQAIAWVQQYIEHAVENELQYTFVQESGAGAGGLS